MVRFPASVDSHLSGEVERPASGFTSLCLLGGLGGGPGSGGTSGANGAPRCSSGGMGGETDLGGFDLRGNGGAGTFRW